MAEMIRIDENTIRFEDGEVRYFLLEGTKKALLIDTGMKSPDAAERAEELTQLPMELINTHADPDHISGNGAFDTFYMHPDEEGNYRAHGGKGGLLSVREGDILDLGERHLKVIEMPGHTPGSIALLDIEKRILFGGDVIQDGNVFMFGERRNLDTYIHSLERLKGFMDEFDFIYPSHGSIPLEKEYILKMIEGARAIQEGKTEGREIEIFGRPVMLYRFPYTGFLCEE